MDQRRLCLPVLYVICEFTPTAFVLPELSPEAAHRCPPLAAPNLPPLCRHLGELLTEQFPPETRLAICTTAQHSRMLQVKIHASYLGQRILAGFFEEFARILFSRRDLSG